MMKLTDTDQFPVQIRAITDGDPANASYTNAAPQDLADRTRWLHNTLTQGGLTRQGATRIRFVEDLAEMAATLDVKRGDVCVASNAGAYVYWGPLGGSPAPAPWAYESTTHPGSYWVHSTFGITDRAGAPGGIVTLDHEGRIPAETPKNGVVKVQRNGYAEHTYTGTSIDYTSMPRISLALKKDDVVDVFTSFSVISSTTAGQQAFVSLALLNASNVPVAMHGPRKVHDSEADRLLPIMGRLIAPSDGNYTVAMGCGMSGASVSWRIACEGLSATVFRP